MKFFKRKQRRNKQSYNIRKPQSLKREKSKISKIKKISIVSIILSLFFSGIYFVVFSNHFLIQDIIIIQDKIKDDNNPLQHYFNSIKGKNIIFNHTTEIEAKILDDHPEIETLEVKKRLPKTLQVEYTDFPISANLLQNNELAQKKFLINQRGQIVKKDIENPNLPYFKISSEEELNLKTEVIKPEKLKYMLESIKYFEEKFGMEVFDATYLHEAREVHLRTEKYFDIWLDMTQDYKTQFIKLKKALAKIDIYNEELNYIDLRIAGTSGEKVIFKRK